MADAVREVRNTTEKREPTAAECVELWRFLSACLERQLRLIEDSRLHDTATSDRNHALFKAEADFLKVRHYNFLDIVYSALTEYYTDVEVPLTT